MIKIDNMAESIQNTNNLTVLILSAGYGRRMGQFSRMVNKGLVPFADKPLISHIIEKFPSNTKFVIACGHLGQQVKDYVSSVHTDKHVVFVDIPDYSEINTGPATTIQYCAEHIQGGFLWLACDTLFDFDYKSRLDHNWIGVYPVDSNISQDYCWVKRDGDKIVEVHNKVKSNSAVDAFIGLMYVKDDTYLQNLQGAAARETYQGFADNLELKAHTVKNWLDFGTYEKWEELVKDLPEVSFPKPDELFYCDNGKIVKYFTKTDHVNCRVIRADLNKACMPSDVKAVGNFLVHKFAPGDIIYNQYTPELFKQMLHWCDTVLWKPEQDSVENFWFCDKFYRKKTLERLEQFRVKYAEWSECRYVNDEEVEDIDFYLNKVDWNWLAETRFWAFIHGDLHFDNTVYDATTNKFTAIDWRTDFAGSLYGDVYYDLAKMLGGLRLNYRSVKNNLLEYHEENDSASIVVPAVNNINTYEGLLKEWVLDKGLSWNKVCLLVPIIYLNMSPLHDPPFDKFLIALSQLSFKKYYDQKL